MIKYHKLIITEEQEVFSQPLQQSELSKMAKQLKDDINKADANPEIHQTLVKIRVVNI